MSAIDCAQISTDELIQGFIQKTQFVGGGWPSPWNIPEQTPEREAMRQEIYAISAELRTRNSIVQVRQLFDHESRDVRSWAAGQFLTIDPEWASATFSGLAAHLSTREVLVLSAHARQGPPAHPAIEEMSNDQLIARFEDAAMREYATRFLGEGDEPQDLELCNKFILEILNIVGELKSKNGIVGLLPLLDHPNITVRHEAATHCLALAPERALPVLERVVATRDSYESFAASRTLDFWRYGVLK